MSIATTDNRVSYSGNGSTTVFSFPNVFLAAADLVVIEKDTTTLVETIKTLTTHYTVSGGSGAVGSVTMLVAPASGKKLIIYNDPALTQGLDLVENDAAPAESLETAFDRACLISQRLSDRMDRAVRLSEGVTATFDPTLPADITDNAGSMLLVNAAGDGLEMGPDAGDIVAAEANAAAAAASATASATYATASAASAAEAALNTPSRSITDLPNIGLEVVVSGGAMTIEIKSRTDVRPATAPLYMPFRSTTNGSGLWTLLPITVNTGLDLPAAAGHTFGHIANKAEYLYVYGINNTVNSGGTLEMAVSSSPHWDEGSLVTTTSISGGASSPTALYSYVVRANVALRYIGRILMTQVTPGTFANAPTEVSIAGPRDQAINAPFLRNYLVNGFFDFWQRGTSVTVANGISTYQADRWYAKNALGTNGVLTFERLAGANNGSKYGASLKISTAPTAAQANGCELFHVLENQDSLAFYGQQASFSAKIKGLNNVTQIGVQLYYKTTEAKVDTAIGTEQTFTVSSGGFATCTFQNFDVGTTQTTSGVIGLRIRITGVSTGALYAINNGFVVEQAALFVGSQLGLVRRAGLSAQQEKAMCQRFFEKSYEDDTAPGTNTSTGIWDRIGVTNSQWFTCGAVTLQCPKRSAPTMACYTSAGTLGSAGVYTFQGASNDLAMSLSATVAMFNIGTTSNTATAGNNVARFHYTADAEI